MKCCALLLLMVICCIWISDSEAWGRRRRWRRVIRHAYRAYKYYKTYKAATAAASLLGRKRDLKTSVHHKCQLSYYDKNDDNKISEAELRAFVKDIRQHRSMFTKFDVDGNGHIDKDEFSARVGLLMVECKNQ